MTNMTIEDRLDALEHKVEWLRQRLAQIHPERHHCPKCKQVVHPKATNCRCGHSWGPKKPDKREGLPR